MQVFISSQERRIMFQAIATGLKLGCTVAESVEMLVSAWESVEKKDRIAVAKQLGSAVTDMVNGFSAQTKDGVPTGTPLLAAVSAAFGADRDGKTRLSVLEHASLAVPAGRMAKWAADGSLQIRIAEILEAAAKAAEAVQGQFQ